MTPARIGYALTANRAPPLKAQGAGRVGGAMAGRLRRMGLVQDVSDPFPLFALTARGRSLVMKWLA